MLAPLFMQGDPKSLVTRPSWYPAKTQGLGLLAPGSRASVIIVPGRVSTPTSVWQDASGAREGWSWAASLPGN